MAGHVYKSCTFEQVLVLGWLFRLVLERIRKDDAVEAVCIYFRPFRVFCWNWEGF